MNPILTLGLLAMMAAAVLGGGYLGTYHTSLLVPPDVANDPVKMEEEKNLMVKNLRKKHPRCTSVECTYTVGESLIECVVSFCSPTAHYGQRCLHVLDAAAKKPCYYEHNPGISDAAYPACCEEYTRVCEGEERYDAGKLPSFTDEEYQKCLGTPIWIS